MNINFLLFLFFIIQLYAYNNATSMHCPLDNIRNYKQNVVLNLYDELNCDDDLADSEMRELCIVLGKIDSHLGTILSMVEKIKIHENQCIMDEKISEEIREASKILEDHFAATRARILDQISPEQLAKIEQDFIIMKNDEKILAKKFKTNLEKISKLNKKLLNKSDPKQEKHKLMLSYQTILIMEQLEQNTKTISNDVQDVSETTVVEQHQRRRKRGRSDFRGCCCCCRCGECCGLDFGALCHGLWKFSVELVITPGKVLWRAGETLVHLGCQGFCSIWWIIFGPMVYCRKRQRACLFYRCTETPVDAFNYVYKDGLADNYGMDQEKCSCWPKLGEKLKKIWHAPSSSQPQVGQQQMPSSYVPGHYPSMAGIQPSPPIYGQQT